MLTKIKLVVPLGLVPLLTLALVGSYFLHSNKAVANFQPLQLGVNFTAGWSDHTDADNLEIIDRLAAAGVKVVRVDVGWSSIEESGDVFGDYTDPKATYVAGQTPLNQWYVKKIDKAVNYANSKGIKVLGIFWTTPSWGCGAAGCNSSSSSYTRPGAGDYSEYAEAASWAAKYWAGRIDNWEIWNEADPDQKFWINKDGTYGGTTEYANLLKAAYPAIKAGNPNAKVLTSGPSSCNDAWISQLYSAGIKGYFDVLATHAYEGMANADPLASDGSKVWFFLHVPAVRQVMVDNGDSDKPIWITEMGWSSHDNTNPLTTKNYNWGVTEQQQGDYLVKSIQYAKANWPYVEVLVHYMDRNRLSANGKDASDETARHQMNFGLLYMSATDTNVRNKPKLSYNILSQYLNSITTKQGDINRDGKVDVYDLSSLLSKWGTTDSLNDINSDGTVDVYDLSTLLNNWG